MKAYYLSVRDDAGSRVRAENAAEVIWEAAERRGEPLPEIVRWPDVVPYRAEPEERMLMRVGMLTARDGRGEPYFDALVALDRERDDGMEVEAMVARACGVPILRLADILGEGERQKWAADASNAGAWESEEDDRR